MKQPSSQTATMTPIGRVLSCSAIGFLLGCVEASAGSLALGAFLQVAGGSTGESGLRIIGVVTDIRVVDDSFARQLVAGDAKADYIKEQRDRRLTPLEVSVLHAGHILPDGEVRHRLPPRPPSALEGVQFAPPEDIRTFLKSPRGGWRFAFLSLLVAAGASNEVLAECVWQAAAAQPPDPQNRFMQEAARELTRLLAGDLQRLYSLLPQLSS